MRTDELRSTLHDRAEAVHGLDASARVGQVHGRVRTVRRRRTAALAAAAAVVTLAGVVSLPPLLDRTPAGPADAPQTLAGHDVPTTEVAAGFTYRYVGGVEGEPGENPLPLQVEVDDRPRLVAFASSDAGSTLTLTGRGGEQAIGAPSGAFTSFMLLESSGQHRLRLRQDDLGDGRLALAIYDLVEEPPAGVTDGVRTFRANVPGHELVDAFIGKAGETDLTRTVVLPEGPLRWHDLCSRGGRGLFVRVQVEGQRGWWGSSCEQQGDRYQDPSASYGGTQSLGTDPAPRGVPVDVRIWLGDEDGGARAPAVEDPDVILGLGVYSERGDWVRVLGQKLQEVDEWFGHSWRVSDVQAGSPGAERFTVDLPASDDTRTVRFVVSGLADDHHLVGGVQGGDESGWSSSVGTTTATHGPFVVLPGEQTVRLRVTRGLTPDTTVAAVVSERAD